MGACRGEATGLAGVVCRKTRHGDREVDVELPPIDLMGREVVLIDDVASTGHTLVQAAQALRARGVARSTRPWCVLFDAPAVERLHAAGIRRI